MNSKAGRQTFLVRGGVVLLIAALIVAVVYWRSRPATKMPFQKGVVYVSWWRGEYASAESDATLSSVIKPMGVNWVSIVVTCYQRDRTTTQIQCDEKRTPTDDDLRHAIQYAHDLGLQVMLKPHVDLSDDDDHWRGEIGFGDDEKAWKAWFASYTDFITRYAALSQEAGVEYFVVGTEFGSASHREVEWRAVAAAVRAAYHGPLTYAANYGDEVVAVKWWDAVDAIGVDAYYPLTDKDDPTVEELKVAWTPIVERLGQVSEEWNRPIIITEIGYQSRDGTNRTPWGVEDDMLDLQEQADSYRALFESFRGKDWWQGVFWWAWDIHPDQGGPANSNFTANDKPAENVLRLNYGAPPRPGE